MKKYTSFEEQKGKRYNRENVYFGVTVFGSLPSTKLCLREKRPENAFNTNSALSQNRTERQIRSSKTTINWFFNDI